MLKGRVRQCVPKIRPLAIRRLVFVNKAWKRAFTSLASTELSLLHQYFVSGFSIDVLADMYEVHRATAARRINRAIECLRQAVKRSFGAHYRDLTKEELYSLMRLSCRHIDLSDTLTSAAGRPLREEIVARVPPIQKAPAVLAAR
jgi:hypothetical protein